MFINILLFLDLCCFKIQFCLSRKIFYKTDPWPYMYLWFTQKSVFAPFSDLYFRQDLWERWMFLMYGILFFIKLICSGFFERDMFCLKGKATQERKFTYMIKIYNSILVTYRLHTTYISFSTKSSPVEATMVRNSFVLKTTEQISLTPHSVSHFWFYYAERRTGN
jgi:hypothetical protein